MTAHRVATIAICVVLASNVGFSQVKTTVPDVVPGARPATVEPIRIHGKALEGSRPDAYLCSRLAIRV